MMSLEFVLDSANLSKKQKKKLLKYIQKCDDPTDAIYNLAGRLQTEPFETVYEDLKKGKTDFDSSYYSSFQEIRDSLDHSIENPPEIKEGTVECPKCKTKKTIIQEIQTRSCDEGFTYKLHCYNPGCKYIKIM